MNPKLVATCTALLILAYLFMCVVFIAHQKRGHNFAASFDKAFLWAGCLFIFGYAIDTAVYAEMA